MIFKMKTLGKELGRDWEGIGKEPLSPVVYCMFVNG